MENYPLQVEREKDWIQNNWKSGIFCERSLLIVNFWVVGLATRTSVLACQCCMHCFAVHKFHDHWRWIIALNNGMVETSGFFVCFCDTCVKLLIEKVQNSTTYSTLSTKANHGNAHALRDGSRKSELGTKVACLHYPRNFRAKRPWIAWAS